ncbi:MAG: Cupin protein [Chloroflexi bacterium]|nr:Cupin protein [Chloroflexota bacterium]
MDIADVGTIPDLNAWMAEHDLSGFWERDTRQPRLEPHLWKWEHIHAALMKANDVVEMDDTGATGRRTVNPRNPSLGGRGNPTLGLAIQCLRPGEVAKAHRHTMKAIRFVVKGDPKCYTIVDEEPMPMEDGDLLVTPGLSWHDHYNGGDETVIWLDGVDAPLTHYLVKGITEPYPGPQQPRRKPVGYSNLVMGYAKPTWLKGERATPPFRYKWTDTLASLNALKEAETEPDPVDGYRLMYANPLTGGPTFPTFACEIQLVIPSQKTMAHRHNCTTIYHVFRGAGTTIADGKRMEWSEGDQFVIPPMSTHQHENDSGQDAILFSISDWPTTSALGLYDEEVL